MIASIFFMGRLPTVKRLRSLTTFNPGLQLARLGLSRGQAEIPALRREKRRSALFIGGS
jgi:hypothetical protein